MADAEDGDQGPSPGPEHEAKHKLTQWLISHGAEVWWEQNNAWDYPTFSVDRNGHSPFYSPDLVVEIHGRTFVIEFKPATERKSGVYDALLQLHGYWVDYVLHGDDYIVDGRTVAVDGFLTATLHSRFGRLFDYDDEGGLQNYVEGEYGRSDIVALGQLPPREYRMTEQHIRTLWRLGKRTEENMIDAAREGDDVPALGSLLSDHLAVEQYDPKPAVLWNRGRTGQDWEVLA